MIAWKTQLHFISCSLPPHASREFHCLVAATVCRPTTTKCATCTLWEYHSSVVHTLFLDLFHLWSTHPAIAVFMISKLTRNGSNIIKLLKNESLNCMCMPTARYKMNLMDEESKCGIFIPHLPVSSGPKFKGDDGAWIFSYKPSQNRSNLRIENRNLDICKTTVSRVPRFVGSECLLVACCVYEGGHLTWRPRSSSYLPPAITSSR